MDNQHNTSNRINNKILSRILWDRVQISFKDFRVSKMANFFQISISNLVQLLVRVWDNKYLFKTININNRVVGKTCNNNLTTQLILLTIV